MFDAIALPRHLHRYPFPTSLIVETQEALDAALADGWHLLPQSVPSEPVMASVTEDTPPITEPVKRGRKPK